MKKLLFIFLAILIALPVFANANWQELHNKGKVFFIDTNSIMVDNSFCQYWIKNYQENTTRKMNLISNCTDNTTAVQKVLIYDENDKIKSSKDLKNALTTVVPDSDSSVAHSYACNICQETLKKEQRAKLINRGIYSGVNVLLGL